MTRRLKPPKPVQEYRLDLPLNGLTLDKCVAAANKLFPRLTVVKGKAVYYLPRGETLVVRFGNLTHYTSLGKSKLTKFGGKLTTDP